MQVSGKWRKAWLNSGQMAIFGLPELKPEIRFGLVPGELVFAVGDSATVGSNIQLFPNGLRYAGILTLRENLADVDCMLFQLSPNLHLCFLIMDKLRLITTGGALDHEAIFTKTKPREL